MTYQELINFIYNNILSRIFDTYTNTTSEALSFEEAFDADSLDYVDILSQTQKSLKINISDTEIRALHARDGNDGIMIITYINFIAEKLNIAIPNERKQYELSMRALKLTAQTTQQSKREISFQDKSLQQIDNTIKQIKIDSVKRQKILNNKIKYIGK